MAKLAFVLALALLAVQSSSAIPINHLQKDAWNIFQYIQFLSYKIEEETKKVTTNLPEDIKSFSDKINIIFSTHNIQNNIAQFKQHLRTISKDGKTCEEDIERKLNFVVEETLKDVASCEDKIQQVADGMQRRFEATSEKGRNLGDLLKVKIVRCAEDHLSNYQEMKKCLEGFVFEIVGQLEDLQFEVDEVLTFARRSIEENMESLEQCVMQVEKKIVVEEDFLVESYQQCVNNL